MRRVTVAAALALLLGLLAAAPARGQAEDAETQGDEYETGDLARIRFHENGATIERASGRDLRPSEERGELNAPIFPGDALRTGRDQRVEVQLADGTLVRLDRLSSLTFQSLPDPYAKYRDNTVLRISAGAVQILPRLPEGEEEFRVDTPGASVYLLGEGDFRIEVEEDGSTRVISRRGVAEVSAEETSVLVRAGMSAWAEPGRRLENPTPFGTFSRDAFDRWCEARDEPYRLTDRVGDREGRDRYEETPEIPYEIRPYYGELSANGHWVWAPTYGWCWYPVGVAPGWRPYLDGYWHYGPAGYFWVSHEPWGWAPYHYGRWGWVGGYGWCWIPGRVFSGAWVAWSWGYHHVGWCPLDYWNRPAFVTTVHLGYYDPVVWTFVSVEHVVVRDVRRYAVPVGTVTRIARDNHVVSRPPRVAPRKLAEGREWRERAVRLAAEDRPARLRAVARDTTPRTRFVDLEPRRLERAAGRAGEPSATRKLPAETRSPIERRRTLSPSAPSRRPEVEAGAEGNRPRPPSPDRPSVRATPGRSAPAASAATAGREGNGRRGAFPRRIPESTSPQGRDPQRVEPARKGQGSAAPPATRQEGGDTRERVREMYQQLSRPRVAERSEPPSPRRSEPSRLRERPGHERTEARTPARPQLPEPASPPPRRTEVRQQRPEPPSPRAARPADSPRPARPQRQEKAPQRSPKKDKN